MSPTRRDWSEWTRQAKGVYTHASLGSAYKERDGWYAYSKALPRQVGPFRTLAAAICRLAADYTAGGGEANR